MHELLAEALAEAILVVARHGMHPEDVRSGEGRVDIGEGERRPVLDVVVAAGIDGDRISEQRHQGRQNYFFGGPYARALQDGVQLAIEADQPLQFACGVRREYRAGPERPVDELLLPAREPAQEWP